MFDVKVWNDDSMSFPFGSSSGESTRGDIRPMGIRRNDPISCAMLIYLGKNATVKATLSRNFKLISASGLNSARIY